MVALAAAGILFSSSAVAANNPGTVLVDDFDRPDELYHGDGLETLNPGYWKIENKTLRRRLKNVGDRNPHKWFPFQWETYPPIPRLEGWTRGQFRNRVGDHDLSEWEAFKKNPKMLIDVEPSLPFGMIWRRDWKLKGNYTICAEFTVRALPPKPEGEPRWMQEKPGYAVMGVCFGGSTLFESRNGGGKSGDASWMALWRDNNSFGIYDHATDKPEPSQAASEKPGPSLKSGDRITIELAVEGSDPETATVTAILTAGSSSTVVKCTEVDRKLFTEGYFGLVSRGLLDFEVNSVEIEPGDNKSLYTPQNDCHTCYALGDRLRLVEGKWHCTFIALFRSNGEKAEVHISNSPNPRGGWKKVPVAGSAPIVNNDFRLNTASIDVTLPFNPADKTMYYTVWKDGHDVTADPRVGTASADPGTGMIEPFFESGEYVGRLPQLKAPYRLAGLGGHAIHGGRANLPGIGQFQENWVHDQPTQDAYRYFEEHELQILVWEDDVWYLELLFPPPSNDDAYKVVTITICGPTGRWQMMRHWNVINPGDHDYGMDDVKGPEQIIIRRHEDLGQDMEYMRRNFKMVNHLISGNENPSGTENPKNWRRWKMPDGDFSILTMDARLWRTSQDTNIWDDQGWGHKKNLYDRTDPTRTLLGEEQFAWLKEMIRTDSSPLICITGINTMHTVFAGMIEDPETGLMWNQRDCHAADYAGWVKAGCDRVIELLGSREGIVTVYGDIHLAHILQNLDNRLYECSFGPIGRLGSRRLKHDFGPEMEDYDGRKVQIHALYHDRYDSPDLKPHTGPNIWNFLDMTFDPRGEDPSFILEIHNIIDPPTETPRGGGVVKEQASNTGRQHTCKLPPIKTLSNADVRFSTEDGRPVRGAKSLGNGTVPVSGLIDVPPGTRIIMTSFDGEKSDAQVIKTF